MKSNNIIITNQYLDIFFTEALKVKLIPQMDYVFANANPPRIIQSYNKIRRQKLFQVLLLYENITLLDIPQYNSRLELRALDSLDDIEYKQSDWDLHKTIDVDFVKYVRKAIMSEFVKNLQANEVLPGNCNYRKYANNYINHIINNSDSSLFSIGDKNCQYLDSLNIVEDFTNIQFKTCITFVKELAAIRSLMDYSSSGGTLLNPRFNLAKLSLKDSSNLDDKFQIIQILLSESIKALPTFDNLIDLLRFRNKHKSELKTLNNTINEWLIIYRESGNLKLIEKARLDIEKAIKELNYGQILDKVSKICTYISVPLSIVETLTFGLPLTSLPVGLIGAASTLKSDKIKKYNQWVQLIS